MTSERSIDTILGTTHPYDALTPEARSALAGKLKWLSLPAGTEIQRSGERQTSLYLIASGSVRVSNADGEVLSILGPGNSFGERGLMRDGIAASTAIAAEDSSVISMPAAVFQDLVAASAPAKRFFERGRRAGSTKPDLTTMSLGEVMTKEPLTCSPDTSVQQAAIAMRDKRVSCILVRDTSGLSGILTTRDITNKVLADALSPDTKAGDVMTPDPVTLSPDALILDALHLMVERGITHLPVEDENGLVGILTQTDLTRVQALSSAGMIREIAGAVDASDLAKVTGGIPELLVQLVGGNNDHQVVTRLITDIADAVTRRLLKLAEAALGPAPAPYLWLACGSQGRQEQTGVSDQDNCLILSDDAAAEDDAYFAALATFVCDGLNEAGYVYCPGDMMATNPRWRKPRRVWKEYFSGWINRPDPEAQMLASVMFDLRPIGGDATLFAGLQSETLAAASKNSIFVAHMVSNSLKHQPPLGLFRGLATIRGGEHKNTLDLKHNGVVPIVDLGRIYALQGQIAAANTRARLQKAMTSGQLSGSGGHDLLDAYDLIADARLEHQAKLIKRGTSPDNYMAPSDLSDFERSHLRDAFVVIKTMQAAAGSRGGPLS
ncbi:MAG: DUF294 nucleotidyltransferase-like domain-containing protein [Pseudomonadota bacterium]